MAAAVMIERPHNNILTKMDIDKNALKDLNKSKLRTK